MCPIESISCSYSCNPGKHKNDDTTDSSFPAWGYVLIFVPLAIILAIGILCYCKWAKRRRQNQLDSTPDETVTPMLE